MLCRPAWSPFSNSSRLPAGTARSSSRRQDYRKIQFEANTAINSDSADWFEGSLTAISGASGLELGAVEAFWLQNAYFTSSLRYVHLGSPERILIVSDDGEDETWHREPPQSLRLGDER